MDKWQVDHIRSNLTELLNTRRCDTSLIARLTAKGVLGDSDRESLKTHGNNYDKSSALYEIVRTRTNGYRGLMEALEETNQNGAFTILKIGFRKNVGRRDSDQSHLTTDTKWGNFLYDHQAIYFAQAPSNKAIEDLTHRFYTEEMTHQLKDHKYYSSHVLSVIHHQVSDTMTDVYTREADKHQLLHQPIQQILERFYNQYENKHKMSLNGHLNFEESPAIGIDLGTCNLCVAVCIQGEVRIISNSAGEKTTPSYVSFGENGKITIGKTARKYIHKNPKFTIYDSKRMIGKTFNDDVLQQDRKHWPFLVNDVGNIPYIVTRDNAFLAEEISGLLLKECKSQAEKNLKQPVTKAVITVPAYFHNSQREATERAGKEAGLEVLKILNEPTAAAINYKQERYYDTAKLVVIFDLGGGTFDVALVSINGEEIKTEGIDGDTHLGGEDFDRIIMDYCIKEFEKSSGINLRNWGTEKDVLRNMANLLLQCEEAKKDLSLEDEVDICVPSIAVDTNLDVKLRRGTFEELCMPLFKNMLEIVERLLVTRDVDRDKVEDIILVGGSTRIPKLQEMLKDFFGGKELNFSINQDHAVAYGAAVQAAILNGEEVKKLLNINRIVDAIPMSIGIQCIKNGVFGQFSRIIERNSKYPNTYKQIYCTYQDNQEAASIRVFQGEQENAADNFFIGMFRFEGIPRALKGRESIEVTMQIDSMGILKVTASCRGITGTKDLKVTLMESSGLKHHLNKRRSRDLE